MFFARRTDLSRRQPETAPNERVYAIGDVHGRLDLLNALLARIGAHAAGCPQGTKIHLILLGDLIDRGPDSASVLRQLHRLQQRPSRLVTLLGNHEQMMLRAIDGEPGMLRLWLRSGGRETLQSFGIEPPNDPDDEFGLLSMISERVPREYIDWIRGFPLTARSGDYLFCHAGIRPGVALNRQTSQDLLWIRTEFLESRSQHGVIVVHGHSVSTEIEERDNRIGIDTGAYRTGKLTALCVDGAERTIISVTEADVAAIDDTGSSNGVGDTDRVPR